MADRGHRSSAGTRPPGRGIDRRVTDLVDHIHSHNLMGQVAKAFARDPFHAMSLEVSSHTRPRQQHAGVVLYAMPHAGWYLVQLDGTAGRMGCCLAEPAAYTPIGVHPVGSIPPRSTVLVDIVAGLGFGVITAVYPIPCHDGRLLVPDCVLQGSASGLKREEVYTAIIRTMYREGGVLNFSCNRPMDETSMDRGWTTETGLALTIDPYLLQMRVNEFCGFWLNYFDSYARLAGINFDWQTAAHNVSVRDDEGEARYAEEHYVYPWEGLGLYAPGTRIDADFDAKKVQYEIHKGAQDLPDGDEDVQPFARYQEHGGYLGQGRLRLVAVPPQPSGTRRYRDNPVATPDFGVFMESIGLDGEYILGSAKGISIVKRPLLCIPKEMQRPEDQAKGDDARKDNYKFSGMSGGGAPHRIGDVTADDPQRHLLQAAGICDLLAHSFNWKPQHPFHYHKEDYIVPNEQDAGKQVGVLRQQEKLNFAELAGKMYMSYPSPKMVRVDHRYGEVEYYERESYWKMMPDGSQVWGDGSGVQMSMIAGTLRIDCPGDIIMAPGRQFIVLAGDDAVVRAHGSVDITANKDLRLMAQHNTQIFGGNEKNGGVLIESRAPGFLADFDGKVGEEVQSGGIILKAKNSAIAAWAGDIYLRTGGDPLRRGQIVLDASRGGDSVVLRGVQVETFAAEFAGTWIGPKDTNSKVSASYVFTNSGAILDKSLTVGGASSLLGSVIMAGGCTNQSGYAAVTGFPFVGKADGGALSRAVSRSRLALQSVKEAGMAQHKAIFPDNFYQQGRPGNDKLIEQAQFGFRDDGGTQYNTTDFKLVESRWQQMVRLGMGSGGKAWDEATLKYQSREQLPWPGKDKWEGNNLLKLAGYTMFDAANGRAKDRLGNYYEEPRLGVFVPGSPKTDFKVIL